MVHVVRSLEPFHQAGVSFPTNFVFLSCHFPPRFRFFAKCLKQRGVNVLGIGDESYDLLPIELKESLKEYYRVASLDDYDQVYRAIGHFIHKFGKIHFIESLNEHWLEMEARLRQDFNVDGYKPAEMNQYKRKSCMKVIFKAAGLPVVPGLLPSTLDEAIAFGKEVGYPLVMKPDVGVGGEGARKICNEEEMRRWWDPKGTYFFEPYISGNIETYDGLTDLNGKIVFHSTLEYGAPVMEMLHGVNDALFYYTKKEIPQDVLDQGLKIVEAFDVVARFFHIEFFRTTEGKLVPLEINLRPPGGITVDMWNYAYRMDIYDEYAKVLTRRPCTRIDVAPVICVYAARRDHWKYKFTHEQVLQQLEKYGTKLDLLYRMPKIFSPVMGDEAYLFVVDTMDQVATMVQMVEGRDL